jgi:hypothetical protein
MEEVMARYFFNILSSGDCVRDDHGQDRPSLHAARTRAIEIARELLPELHDSRRATQVTAFEITDEHGRLCLRILSRLPRQFRPMLEWARCTD